MPWRVAYFCYFTDVKKEGTIVLRHGLEVFVMMVQKQILYGLALLKCFLREIKTRFLKKIIMQNIERGFCVASTNLMSQNFHGKTDSAQQ